SAREVISTYASSRPAVGGVEPRASRAAQCATAEPRAAERNPLAWPMMKVLVVNVGSTSVKYNLYDMDTEARLAVGRVERVGTPEAQHVHETGSVAIDGSSVASSLGA